MLRFITTYVISLVLLTGAVAATDVHVTIKDTNGKAIRDAIVALRPVDPGQTVPDIYPEPVMEQKSMMFRPFVLPIKVGTIVQFPNRDVIRHHVYSFSKPKNFELRLYGQDETQEVHFEKKGIVALGCNIHDNMLAYAYVSDAPVAARTDKRGTTLIKGVPEGEYTVELWHPAQKRSDDAKEEIRLQVAGASTEAEWALSMKRNRRYQLPPEENIYN